MTYAFGQKREKCSLRQFNHLDFVSQFTTDIRHISGQDEVAKSLSRMEQSARPFPQRLWLKRRQTMQNSPPLRMAPLLSGW
jgi:hypothetical protein